MRRCLICLGVLCAACLPAARPTDMEDWEACVIKSSELAPSTRDDGDAQLAIQPGSAEVLVVHTRWGAGGLIAIEHTWGSLQLELPSALRNGQRLEIGAAGTRAEYAQGHSIVNYRSERVVGSVRVLDQDDDELELEIDLRATGPSIDLAKEGEIALRGVVDAERVGAQRDCD